MPVRAATREDVAAMAQLALATPGAAIWTEAQYQEMFNPSAAVLRHAVMFEEPERIAGFAVARSSRGRYFVLPRYEDCTSGGASAIAQKKLLNPVECGFAAVLAFERLRRCLPEKHRRSSGWPLKSVNS